MGMKNEVRSYPHLSEEQARCLVKEIEELRDLERSRKSIQAVKEMMTVLNKQ